MADSVFAAVEGIRRGGQTTIDHLATSLVVSVLPPGLRMQWETKTEDEPLVPHIDKWISFVRQKATNASQSQKSASAPSQPPKEHKKPQKHYGKSEGKVYTNHSEPATPGNAEETTPAKSRIKPPKGNSSTAKFPCTLCSSLHFLFQCRQFQDMTVTQRREHVQSSSLCFNCLKSGHSVKDCLCSYRCRLCKKQHNTLLHTDAGAVSTTVNHVIPTSETTSESPISSQQKERLLMTSQVLLTDAVGHQIEARAMIDSGAAVSVMSSRMMSHLQLRKGDEWMTVSGVESSKNSPARPTTNVTVTSLFNPGWSTTVKVVILPRATRDLPEHPLPSLENMPHLKGLPLADPHFQTPRRVDLILDVAVMDDVMLPEKITGPPGTPSAWKTELGWGVMGKYVTDSSVSVHSPAVDTISAKEVEGMQLDRALEKFWLMEELPQGAPTFSAQETAILNQYEQTHYFSSSAGKYVVALPKRKTTLQLGESRRTALNRFLRNEQSLIKKGTWAQFQAVVQEYLTLGHAQLVTSQEMCTPVHMSYYLPMHAVFKSSSTSTKLRVVFDASCPSSSGVALNDILAAGPTLHPNLDIILIRFRKYRVALSGDVGKMYREVMLCQPDRQLHRFLWRPQPDQPVADYCMNRVTFGVTSSPYVAVQTLQQTAKDFSTPDSKASWHVKESFYVDDLLAGADSVQEAIELYKELREVLEKGGFELKKWRSSSSEVLASIPPELQELIPQQEFIDNHSASYPKTLGISWNSRDDVMAAQVQLPPEFVLTKRGIVSDTAKSFDVLGWMSPFIIRMKTLFQLLWKKKVDWDTELDEDLTAQHVQWRSELSILKNIVLPRCYFSPAASVSVQLHGFSDASEMAYDTSGLCMKMAPSPADWWWPRPGWPPSTQSVSQGWSFVGQKCYQNFWLQPDILSIFQNQMFLLGATALWPWPG